MANLKTDDIRKALRRKEHALQALEGLTNEAIIFLRDTMRGDEKALGLRAAETVLAYALGKPRQQSEVTVNVVNPAQAHYAALQELTQLAAKHAAAPNLNPLNSLPDLTSHDKLSINHAPTIEGELIPLPPKSDDKSMG